MSQRNFKALGFLLLPLLFLSACDQGDSPADNPSQASSTHAAPELVIYQDSGKELGTLYDVVVYSKDKDSASAALVEVRTLTRELEVQFSEWKPDSEISRLNAKAADNPFQVSPDMEKMLKGAIAVSKATGGAFDITFKPLNEIWKQAEAIGSPPSDAVVRSCLEKVGYQKLRLADGQVSFQNQGMELGIAGFAKGWIIDALFHRLKKLGEEHFIVNIGGDLRTMGLNESGKQHQLKILNPYDTTHTVATFPASDIAVATSGLSFRYREIQGKRYGHIIDPRTGYPPEFQGSVTVLTRDAAMADALATAFFVMGPQKGIAFAKRTPGVDVVFVERSRIISTIDTLDVKDPSFELIFK